MQPNERRLPRIAAAPVPVRSDEELIDRWLSAHAVQSRATYLAYAREARRFVAWLKLFRPDGGYTFARVTPDDVEAFAEWLGCVTPPLSASQLASIGLSAQPKRGVLSETSLHQAMVIVGQLFEFGAASDATDGRPYLGRNPFNHRRRLRRAVCEQARIASPARRRSLTPEEFALVERVIDDLPERSAREAMKKARLRWLVCLLYRFWLRREEVWALTVGHVATEGSRNVLSGLDQKHRPWKIGVPADLLVDFYRQLGGAELQRTLPSLSPVPLVSSLRDPRATITSITVYAMIRGLGARAASLATDPTSAARLRRLSPQWIRNTGIAAFLRTGGDARIAKMQARRSYGSIDAILPLDGARTAA